MSVATKAKRIKLVFGIVIPVLVLVTTIVMVSMSFAWFSQETTASIQSINLATQKAFVLEFGSSGGTNDNLPYMGQTALLPDGVDRGCVINKANELNYDQDMPFYFVSQLNISSEADENGQGKNLKLVLENVTIKNGDSYFDIYNDSGTNSGIENGSPKPHKNSDVELAFTWFFKAHTTEVAANNKTNDNKMKAIEPQNEETWYTPYGTFVFGENGVVSTVDGIAKPASLPEKRTDYYIENFSTNGQQKFDFYIVFAPEKAYWSQYFTPISTTDTVKYTYDQITEMYGVEVSAGNLETVVPQMYYSDMRYMNSTFTFGASLSVIG